MTEKKHTPGPWFTTTDGVVSGPTESGPRFYARSNLRSGWNFEEIKANDALIAAAPDMLAELETLRDLLLGYAGHHQAKGDDVKADANMVHVYRIEDLLKKASPQ